MRPRRGRFSGLARLARGAILGAAVLLITASGHAAGHGGGLPDVPALLVLLPLFVVLSTSLADRRLTPAALLGYLIGTQVFAHVLLVVGFGHGGHAGSAELTPSPRMLLGHAVATALVLLVLVYGEDLLHRWLRFLADLARRWDAFVAAPPACAGPVHVSDLALEPTSTFRSSVRRRGPPSH